MLATTVIVLKGAQASSVAITLDVLAAANRVCEVLGDPPAFDVRLSGSSAWFWTSASRKSPTWRWGFSPRPMKRWSTLRPG